MIFRFFSLLENKIALPTLTKAMFYHTIYTLTSGRTFTLTHEKKENIFRLMNGKEKKQKEKPFNIITEDFCFRKLFGFKISQ